MLLLDRIYFEFIIILNNSEHFLDKSLIFFVKSLFVINLIYQIYGMYWIMYSILVSTLKEVESRQQNLLFINIIISIINYICICFTDNFTNILEYIYKVIGFYPSIFVVVILSFGIYCIIFLTSYFTKLCIDESIKQINISTDSKNR